VSDRELRELIASNSDTSTDPSVIPNPVNLVLEQTNLGRGDHWFDVIERRSFDILTEHVSVHKLMDGQLVECDRAEFGHLSTRFTYLIKWKYKVNAVGFRTLKGDLSQHHLVTGRDRYALFFWQGACASSSEKGASALLSRDLAGASAIESLAASLGSVDGGGDSKRLIPHVQVFQFKEMPAFCGLFSGRMCVLSDGSGTDDNSVWRMFELRGEVDREAHLIEIEHVAFESLRTKTSFLFVNSAERSLIVWHGFRSDETHRRLMRSCAENLKKWFGLIKVFFSFS
jgi:supervillin